MEAAPKVAKTRPGISIALDKWHYVEERAIATGKNKSQVVEEAIQLMMDTDTRNPVEVQRKKVVADLADVLAQLKKLINDKQYRRFRVIAGFLIHDPKNNKNGSNYPAGPYLEMLFSIDNGAITEYQNEDWDAIRVKAVEDFKAGAEWVHVLKSREGIEIESEVEIDQACDLASEIKNLKKLKGELEVKNKALRIKQAEDRILEKVADSMRSTARIASVKTELKQAGPNDSDASQELLLDSQGVSEVAPSASE